MSSASLDDGASGSLRRKRVRSKYTARACVTCRRSKLKALITSNYTLKDCLKLTRLCSVRERIHATDAVIMVEDAFIRRIRRPQKHCRTSVDPPRRKPR
jgi:hypothetical protein